MTPNRRAAVWTGLLFLSAAVAVWLGWAELACWWLGVTPRVLFSENVRYEVFRPSLWDSTFEFRGLELQKASLGGKSKITASRLGLQLAPKASNGKRFVATEACLEDIEVVIAERADDDARIQPYGPNPDFAERWFDNAMLTLTEDMTPYFESASGGEQLGHRRALQCGKLRQQANDFRGRFAVAKPKPRSALFNPLRDQRRTVQVDRAAWERDLTDLESRYDQLLDLVADDKDQLAKVEARNKRRLRDRFQLVPIEPDTLAEYLFAKQDKETVAKMLQAVAWQQGLLHELAAINSQGPTADWLVESLRFDGVCRYRGSAYAFEGDGLALSSQPIPHAPRSNLQLEIKGPLDLQRMATVIQWETTFLTDGSTRRVRIECPVFSLPAARFGNTKHFAMGMPPVPASLSGEVRVTNTRCEGKITLVRKIDREAALQINALNDSLESAVEEVVRDARSMEFEIQVSGPIHEPRLKVSSLLVDRLASTINEEYQYELDHRREEWSEILDRKARAKADEIDNQTADKFTDIRRFLDSERRRLQSVDETAERKVDRWKSLR